VRHTYIQIYKQNSEYHFFILRGAENTQIYQKLKLASPPMITVPCHMPQFNRMKMRKQTLIKLVLIAVPVEVGLSGSEKKLELGTSFSGHAREWRQIGQQCCGT
jgi:hypothetical protein